MEVLGIVFIILVAAMVLAAIVFVALLDTGHLAVPPSAPHVIATTDQ